MACRRSLGDLDIKTNRQLLWRIARLVVAGLIFQSSAYDIFSRLHRQQRTHQDIHLEISRINIELLIGSERKAHILPLRIGGFPDHDIGSGFNLKHRRNQILRLRLVRINVVAVSHPKFKRNRSWFPLHGSHGHNRGYLYDRGLRNGAILG